MLPVATSGRWMSARRTLLLKSGPPLADTGKTLTKSAPSSAARTISVGVIVPGMLIASRARAASIISGTRIAETRKRAPARSDSSACTPFSTVPAPTIDPRDANVSSAASSSITANASGTVSVISMRRMPPSLIALAAWRASSAVGMRITATSRSSPKMRMRSRRVTSGRCVMAISRWYVSGPVESAFDQEHSCRRAVAVLDLEGSAHEVVDARTDATEVEPLDDHDARSEQRLVDRISGFLGALRLDREVVDPDELDPMRDAPRRRARVDRGEVAGERPRWVGPAGAVACLEEQPLGPRRDARRAQPLVRDVALLGELEDAGWSDEGVERKPVRGVPALDEVERRVDVCPGVVAEGHDRDVRGVALADAAQRLEPRSGLAGPGHHVRPQHQRDVVDLHLGDGARIRAE